MSSPETLGIRRIESLFYYVHDLERHRRYLVDKLDFAEIGRSDPALEAAGKQRSAAFRAGDVTLVLCEPLGIGGRAWRFLRKHPEGVGTLVFEVADVERTFRLIEARGGTPISDVQTHAVGGGRIKHFSVTTPFGDTTFRFVERDPGTTLFPGFVPFDAPVGGTNAFGIGHIDHVTSNFQTMSPALLWMEHVCGFERFWKVEFHTNDVAKHESKGSGLRSIVMWDPESGVRFANNEPLRPFFKQSQINLFGEDHRGDGVQHAALTVGSIIPAVRDLRARGVEFMPTPGTYYDALPERLKRIGVGEIDEDVQTLRELEILVDGAATRSYLLQIFLREQAGLHKDREAGPFFFELIQRKGDQGFGAGNFRALFESIERQQRAEGRL